MDHVLSSLLERRFGDGIPVPERLEDNPVLRSLAAQTSHRLFEAGPVDAALLQTVIACALCAPSKSDLQQAGIVHVADRARQRAIADLIPSMPWIADAPVLLVFCGDNRRIRRICERRGTPFGNDHLDSFFNATVDAALVMGHFLQAAQGAGLGCCPLSAVRIHARTISDWLALPRWVFPVAGVVAGHPVRGTRVTPRLGLDATVHRDRWSDDGGDAAVDRYDRRRDGVMPIAADKQRQVERFGHCDFYGWSTDKARQVADPERDDFGGYVRDQGFDLR